MTQYRLHSIESAPEKSKPSLQGLREAVGFVPNLPAAMAEAPALIGGFLQAVGAFRGSSFTGAEREVLLLSNAVTNKASWPVAFHSTMALKEGVDPEGVRALREKRTPGDAKVAALAAFTRALIEKRGHVDAADLASFTAAGYSAAQSLKVVVGLAVSTMANYASSITNPPLDDPFQPQAWKA